MRSTTSSGVPEPPRARSSSSRGPKHIRIPYAGPTKDGQPNNFAVFRPKKNSFRAEIHLKSVPDIDQQLEEAGIDAMDYDKRIGCASRKTTSRNMLTCCSGC
jgi:hypothetical protein